MSAPDLSRVHELAAQLAVELERLTRAAPANAELRAALALAEQIGPRLQAAATARGIVDPPSPDTEPRDPEVR